ncbi:DUF305 domain-containing protein [Micromonospora endolithica]|uniref:DUF305 domain-containing protein n=1 Tax=Micromonospora endolithica TaxID=230091 RepID=A0A3A9YRY6_9ACTN|nr:DUF305 domain-containing protein [Micromonospora endolithica]RKN38244.1 DUF305 domain-containing protein [Micromonospora endolithica]TWJ25204.1 uncharacterized protein (DUF305 family) [Micromonospora endolithica]
MTRTYLRRAVLAAAGFTAAVTLAGCGAGEHNTAGGHSATTASPSVTSRQSSPGAGNSADVMFAQMMIPHHQQAVQMADLAATRATDPQVKQLAAQIKAAQGPEIATMTRWLAAWGTSTPSVGATGGMHHGASPNSTPGMDHDMPGMMSHADMATLAAATGTDFDKQFLTMMIAHHQGAITMAKDETKNGANTDAKALAQQIVDDQQAEIDTMNRILDRL